MLCVLISVVLAVCQIFDPLSLAYATTTDQTTDDVTISMQTYATNYPQSISFKASNNTVAYCLDYQKNPPANGQSYSVARTATGGLGYIALHGYNNTTYIEGEELSRDEATAATQYAFWIYRGALDREGKLLIPVGDSPVGYTPYLRIRSEKAWQAAVRLADAAKAFEDDPERNTPDAPENTSSQVYMQSDGGTTNQEMMLITVVSGNVTLSKDSSDPRTISSQGDSNARYSLRGAVFKVWRDEDCTIDTGTFLKTDAYGTGTLYRKAYGIDRATTLPLGTYYVRESEAPKGYELDDTVYKVEVRRDEVSQLVPTGESIHETPVTYALNLVKRSSSPTLTNHNGLYSLEGAVYGVWSSKDGAQALEDATLAKDPTQLDGYWFLVQASANNNYSLDADAQGGVTLEHFSAASDQKWQMIANEDGSYSLKNEATGAYLAAASSGSEVTTSSDAFTGWHVEAKDSGTYAISSDNGASLIPAADSIEPGTKVCTATKDETERGAWFLRRASSFQGSITTDENGKGSLSNLPQGTYYLREISAPQGYDLDDTIHVATITTQDATVTATDTPLTSTADVVALKSADGTSEDGATVYLAGAQFTVDYYAGAYASRGALPATPTRSWTLITDSDGRASLAGAARDPDSYLAQGSDALYLDSSGEAILPLGTLAVRESKAPEGYEISDSETHLLHISQTTTGDGSKGVSTFTPLEVSDRVGRGNLEIIKTDATTGEPLAGVPFLIHSKTTGEEHLVVTNEQGVASTSIAPHAQNTNRNDLALQGVSGGSASEVSDSNLSPEYGIWFYVGNGTRTDPNNGQGALPYGDYTITELPCSANHGYGLLDAFDVTVSADEPVVRRSVVNTPVSITTTLTNRTTGSHTVSQGDAVDLVDTVSYQGLNPGTSYELRCTLMDKDTHAPLMAEGEPVSASTTFVAAQSSGSSEVVLDCSGAIVEGKTVVAFERLYCKGRELAVHADLNDDAQSVTFTRPTNPPSIKTKASDTKTSIAQAASTSSEALCDTVTYANLTPGNTYTLTTSLHVRASDGTDLGTAQDGDGNILESSHDFTPATADGTITSELTVDTTRYEGSTLVFFEEVSLEGNPVASHNDIGDTDQSISVPHIATTASNEHDGKTLGAREHARFKDEVSYSNLIPGQEYRLVATLMDKETREVIRRDGRAVTAESTFTPPLSDGIQTVWFDTDTSDLTGQTVVAFETLLLGDHTVAQHEDYEDESQTLFIPAISTTLADATSGEHSAQPDTNTRLIDHVTYSNLVPGTEYTLHGVLVNKQTGEPVKDADGNTIETTCTFTPIETNGTQDIEFELDTTALADAELVAFEDLLCGGELMCTHSDLNDVNQTVVIQPLSTPDTTSGTSSPVLPTRQSHHSTSALPTTGDSRHDALIMVALVGGICVVLGRLEFASPRRRRRH